MLNNYCCPEHLSADLSGNVRLFQRVSLHLDGILEPSLPASPTTAQSAHHMLAPHCHEKPTDLKSTLTCCPFPLVSPLLFKSWGLKLTCRRASSLCSLSCWWSLLGVRWAAPKALCGCSKQVFSCCIFSYRAWAAPQRPLGRVGWSISGSWPGANILSLPFWL